MAILRNRARSSDSILSDSIPFHYVLCRRSRRYTYHIISYHSPYACLPTQSQSNPKSNPNPNPQNPKPKLRVTPHEHVYKNKDFFYSRRSASGPRIASSSPPPPRALKRSLHAPARQSPASRQLVITTFYSYSRSYSYSCSRSCYDSYHFRKNRENRKKKEERREKK